MTPPQKPYSSTKPVLVTGATGMIGRAVVARLCRDNLPVRAQVRDLVDFHRLAAGGSQVEARKLEFERATTGEFAGLVAGCSAVVHTAALVHASGAPYREYELVNVRSSQQLAEA